MSAPRRLRIGVLASGEGTTLQAILDACASGELDAEVAIVISNNSDSGALAKARAAAVRGVHLSSATHPDPGDLDAAILSALRDAHVELVLLAGYMKKIGPKTLAAYPRRILNTHPALLPAYGGKGMYGRRVYESVLAAGEQHTGVTVHLVDGEYDHGPIVAQTRIPILGGDDVESLSARVRAVERKFLVQTLQALVREEEDRALHVPPREPATRLMRFPGAARRDPAIDRWMAEHSDELGAIARRWFEVMRACGDDVRELLHDGHPTACVADAAFAYVNAFKVHVNVGFFRGAEIADPDGLLEGTGKFMRHVKLRPGDDVRPAGLKRLIERAYADMKRRAEAEQLAR